MTSPTDIQEVLDGLARHGSLLLSGPPACGKTRLLQEVGEAFKNTGAPLTPANPTLQQVGHVAIPKGTQQSTAGLRHLPSPNRPQRDVQKIAFSANTKNRDFTTAFGPAVASGQGFQVIEGALVTANKTALSGSAVLLIIDEMNRGPAVQLFGDAIVALEKNCRLLPDDRIGPSSFPFSVLDPSSGQPRAEFLSDHLYILGAMNQADVSIEPMDTAFLRRFSRINLEPRADVVRSLLGASGPNAVLPTVTPSPADLMEALVRAWAHVNDQISVGLSPDHRIGHGVLLGSPSPPSSTTEAERVATESWSRVASHVKEVFFGDVLGQSLAFQASSGSQHYKLQNVAFGQVQRQRLEEPTISSSNIYAVLTQVGA